MHLAVCLLICINLILKFYLKKSSLELLVMKIFSYLRTQKYTIQFKDVGSSEQPPNQ